MLLDRLKKEVFQKGTQTHKVWNCIFTKIKGIAQRQCATGNSYPPCFTLTSCVDKQWRNSNTAECSVDTAVAIPGNILTLIVSILKKYTMCSPF